MLSYNNNNVVAEATKGIRRTDNTAHRPQATYRGTLRNNLKKETHAAFTKSKLPSLRNSPVYIVWPTPQPKEEVVVASANPSTTMIRPSETDYASNTALSSRNASPYTTMVDTEGMPSMKDRTSDASKSTAESSRTFKSDKKGSTSSKTPSLKKKKLKIRATTRSGKDSNLEEDQEDEFGEKVKKVHSNSSFWKLVIGNNVRIDSMNIGTPRRDPYQSTWTRDQRRCFFTSGFIPQHQRLHIPRIANSKMMKDFVRE